MNTRLHGWVFGLSIFLGLGFVSRAECEELALPNNLSEAITNGRALLQVRPRLNYIDEQSRPERAEALNTRLLFGWRTAPYKNLRLTMEGIHTDYFGDKRFNDDPRLIFSSRYPLLPDPRITDVNQLHLEYSGLPSTRVRLGRQILRMGNQRFISDNDFRQIPRVFNGVSVVITGIEQTEILVGHMERVRDNLGNQARLRLDMLHVAYNPLPASSVAAYAYSHDQAATGSFTGFANNSYRILGLRGQGSFGSEAGLMFDLSLEYAKQDNLSGGDDRIDAHYYHVGAGASRGNYGASIHYEVKGSNHGTYGFQTPLTDLYAFNGLALQFTSTPRQGLSDGWLAFHLNVQDFEFLVDYHRFRSDFGGLDLGREADVGISYPLRDNLRARLQYARFRPGEVATPFGDVDKAWFTLTYNF
jgi:Alginate export